MSKWEIIRWWELRRLLYNAILFIIGIASIIAMEMLTQKLQQIARILARTARLGRLCPFKSQRDEIQPTYKSINHIRIFPSLHFHVTEFRNRLFKHWGLSPKTTPKPRWVDVKGENGVGTAHSPAALMRPLPLFHLSRALG